MQTVMTVNNFIFYEAANFALDYLANEYKFFAMKFACCFPCSHPCSKLFF